MTSIYLIAQGKANLRGIGKKRFNFQFVDAFLHVLMASLATREI
jgi:hypothetical protein